MTALNVVTTSLTTTSCWCDAPLFHGDRLFFTKREFVATMRKRPRRPPGLAGHPSHDRRFRSAGAMAPIAGARRLGSFLCLDLMPEDRDFVVRGWDPGPGIFFKTLQDSNMQPRWRSSGAPGQILGKTLTTGHTEGKGRLIGSCPITETFVSGKR